MRLSKPQLFLVLVVRGPVVLVWSQWHMWGTRRLRYFQQASWRKGVWYTVSFMALSLVGFCAGASVPQSGILQLGAKSMTLSGKKLAASWQRWTGPLSWQVIGIVHQATWITVGFLRACKQGWSRA